MHALRLIAGYSAVASALPYFALKIVWLTGGTLGVADEAMMRGSNMIALNALTAGMDLVAIGLALAFTHRWGLRIPAWLLLPPIWVATGLLARFMVGVPVTAMAAALSPASAPRPAGGPVLPWVYAVVYTEFVGMGIGLTVAFVLYAMTRWSATLRPATIAVSPGATHDLQRALATVSAGAAAVLAALLIAWALGATIGLPAAAAAQRTIVGSLINAIDGLLALGGAAGVLMMVHRFGGHRPFWMPLALTWLGAGSMFGWGLWQLIIVLSQSPLLRAAEGMAVVNLAGLLRLVIGLVMGLLMVFALAERASATAKPSETGT